MDYYELLGVSREADGEAIKKAFHAAARDLHPDVSDAPDAEQRFRELAEAYSVLSKAPSRLLYDRFGYRGRGNSGFEETLWEARTPVPRGDNVHTDLEVRADEAQQGVWRIIRFEAAQPCESCDGLGTANEPDPNCPECGGSGRSRQVAHLEVGRLLTIQTCPVCSEPCDKCEGVGRRLVTRMLKVGIPAQVEDGAQLRVGGEGHAAEHGGVPGDLLIDLTVLPEPRDLRVVRYIAVALFLAAVVLLVVYLLLH